jgi:hypothetical protein
VVNRALPIPHSFRSNLGPYRAGGGSVFCERDPASSTAGTTWAERPARHRSSPGLVAIADQIAGHGLGLINPTLYALGVGPNYGTYFYDVTTGNNQAAPSVQGFPATTGWDPVTGLGTPNAAALVPALAAG